MFQSRTHTCNELRMEHVGQPVKIVGWMENVREVGSNLAFVILRDFYGTTQVVIETEDMMAIINSLNKESTISVEGVVLNWAGRSTFSLMRSIHGYTKFRKLQWENWLSFSRKNWI